VAAKQLHQDITRNTVEPLLQSPTGQLSAAETFPKQAQILFNTNPLPGSERAVGTAVRQIASKDPEAAQQMVRMYLEKTFNEATQNNMSGPNQFGGAKFAATVAGNSQQAKNLEAIITALPNGATRWAAFKKAQDIFEAMGTRQPVGSQTAFNQQFLESLKGTGNLVDLASTAASPTKLAGLASDVYGKYAFGKNTKALAQAMVSGDVKDLIRVAGANPNSVKSQAALMGYLAREGAQSNDQDRRER
jgi:hypothetical protein